MPRYFFRLSNGETLMDEEGEELADHDAACAVAVEVFAETIPSRSESLAEGGDYEVMVTDADKGQVYSITAQGRRF
jgi:hypothetical protein